MKRFNLISVCVGITCIVFANGSAIALQHRHHSRAPRRHHTAAKQADVGIDIALVKSHAALRGRAGSGPVSETLHKGELLALVSRTARNGWLDVIDVDTTTEGWVKKSDVSVRLTHKKSSFNPFQAVANGTEDNPEVEVTNSSDRRISLKVGPDRFNLEPNRTQTVNVSAGDLDYYASTPGVLPAIGHHAFKRGYTYTWRFWID